MKPTILVVEDDTSLRHLLVDELETEGYSVAAVSSAEEAEPLLKERTPDLLITDLRLPGANGMSLLSFTQQITPKPLVLIITAFGSVRQAVAALKAGADEFLTKPLDTDHLLLTVAKLLTNRRLVAELENYRALSKENNFHGMLGASAPMVNLYHQIERIAKADGPVLLLGESGTGKELVARALHSESNKRQGPFVAVNCGGIPGELLESEFFGHTSGAFTGARNRRQGLFQQADGGTLLLDEIAEMPLPLQAKLLRVLQDGEVKPVGSDSPFHVDIRILAATNRDLAQAVEDGDFRQDLYFRLETFALKIPPLRNREEDVLLLANHFLAHFSAQRKIAIRGLSDAAIHCLRQYTFPGNVRELENAMERAVTFCDTGIIEPADLPQRISSPATMTAPQAIDEGGFSVAQFEDMEEPLMTLEAMQKRYIHFVVQRSEGNKRRAADILGITRRTLYRWLDEH